LLDAVQKHAPEVKELRVRVVTKQPGS
jgi:hypothetical protein